MNSPQSLSVEEIRQYMLENGCKVTNHALVKHFKSFLTNPSTQNDARKQFKTYVNILATIKNENNQKYLILRKKYLEECPSADMADRALAAADCVPGSPGGNSLISESGLSSPFRQPPPYKPPPQVNSAKAAPSAVILSSSQTSVQKEHVENYRDCVNEFAVAVNILDPTRLEKPNKDVHTTESAVASADEKQLHDKSVSLEKITEQGANKENIARFSFSSGTSGTSIDSTSVEKVSNSDGEVNENPISVKEATKKFNRMASEEESKIISPPAKKKPEKQLIEVNVSQEVLLSHAKSKEWIVSMAKANYQEIAKLANEFPELVKLQDPSTGYTALHWAAKHGNEDVVKLIAGTYNADVNSKTNGGYTPLHLAMQFGRDNIFELLCNVYKANRDIMDWSGNKPLDYLKQRTSISQSTYSSEYYDLFNTPHFAELNSIRLIAGGGTISGPLTRIKKRSHLRYATVSAASDSPLARTQSLVLKSTRSYKKIPSKSLLFAENGLMPAGFMEERSLSNINNAINTSHLYPIENGTDDVGYSKGGTSSKDNSVRRKESFLRKTLRAASSNKHNQDVVTNSALPE